MTAPTAAKTESRWTVEAMQRRLQKDPVAVERALQTLYYLQTETERNTASTQEDNGVGFTGADAEILTSLAKWVVGSRRGPGEKLTPKQLKLAQKKIVKYAAQLLRVSGCPVRHEKKVKKEGAKSAPSPILQWDEQVAVTERSIHDWYDGWTVAIPVNMDRLEATDAEISAEVTSHNQSSYGALRWHTYRYVGRTAGRADVLVEVTEHLCD